MQAAGINTTKAEAQSAQWTSVMARLLKSAGLNVLPEHISQFHNPIPSMSLKRKST
jgi:hypothetical protein